MRPTSQRKTGHAWSMWIVAAAFAVVLASSTVPTPLYLIYRRAFGFSEITLTLIYSVYVVGNLGALFIFGRLSDQIGRKSTTFPALAIAVASTVVFAFAHSTAWLFAARLLSGLATGMASGTATAWIAELEPAGNKVTATTVASAANLAGLSAGPLFAGLLAQHSSSAVRLPWVVYLAMVFAVGIAISFTRETLEDRITELSRISLRPRLGVPREIRSKFISPTVTAFGIFSLAGFYSALIPGLLSQGLHKSSPAMSGSIVFELFGVASLAVILFAGVKSRPAMLTGLIVLLPSLLFLILSEALRSMPLLLTGTLLGGVATALGYRGSLEIVNEISPDEKRSEVVSSYLIACYLGNSVPVIGVGVLSKIATPLAAHLTFATVVAVFGIVGLLTGLKYAPDDKMSRKSVVGS